VAQRITPEEWDRCAAAVGIEWIEPVKSGNTATHARCLACGREWEAWPSNVRAGHGCKVCGGRRASEKAWEIRGRKPQDAWDAEAAAVGIEWESDVTNGGKVKTAARCLSCGYRWEILPSAVHQDEGCPNCAGRIVTSDDWADSIGRRNTGLLDRE
jgi:predicted  nucleic acid-binding Zn-ribbon protein